MLVLCFVPALFGCAKFMEKFSRLDKNSTEIRFSGGERGLESLAALNGKLLVYAIGVVPGSLRKTFRFDSEELANEGPPAFLKNGSYRFFFVGFSAAGMTTDVRCGQANGGEPIELVGKQVTVQVMMSKANCTLPAFAANVDQFDASTGFEPVKFVSCEAGASVGGFTDSSDCTGMKGDLNHVASVKVELLGFETQQGDPFSVEALRPGIGSACVRGNGLPSFGAALTNTDTASWAVHSVSSSVVLAGLASNGMFRSTDGGESFSYVSVGSDNIRDVHGYGDNLVAGTTTGVYFSSNGGATWSASSLTSGTFWAVFAASSSIIFAGNESGEVYKSTNAGQTWAQIASLSGTVGVIETIYADPSGTHLYVGGTYSGTNAKLAHSSDGGANFSLTYTSGGEGGVWKVKKLGAYIYWGTDAGLFRLNSDNASLTQYCNSGCANINRLPGNAVRDFKLHENTLYVATDAGVGVSVGNDPDTSSSWENYTTTHLTSVYLSVFDLEIANGKVFVTASGSQNPVGVSNSRGSGASFPGTATVHLPTGGSPGLPLATRATVYNDPFCQSPRRSYFFPRGVGGVLLSPVGEAVFRSGAQSNTLLVLRDF